MKRSSPRAAFVMTFSALGVVACHKEEVHAFECKPPDCHMNPPPPPPRVVDAGQGEPLAASPGPAASGNAVAPSSALYSKVLNPRDPKTNNTIHATGDGHCVIFPDQPKGTPPPTRAVAPASQPIACPASMKDGPFKECVYGTIMALADESSCVCAQVVSNPPAAPTTISCPKK